MNCTTCRYELSQCLDGRLPSGRRTEVLNHAESCATCGSFWLELQAAQKLTLSLRQAEVGSNFREQLWERINAGEGTPNAVFHEQVPLLSKMRYALTGAAAAAALLVGISYLHTDGDNPPPPTTTNNIASINGQQQDIESNSGNQAPPGGEVAPQADLASHGTLEPLLLRDAPSWFVPMSYESVARETSRQFEDRYTTAARGLRNLNNPAVSPTAAINEILTSAHEMRAFGQLLLDLREHQALFFEEEEVGFRLRTAVDQLDQVKRIDAPTPQVVDALIRPILNDHRLSKISTTYLLKPRQQKEQQDHLMVLNALRPEVFSKLFYYRVAQSAPNQLQVQPGATFWLSNDCQTLLVAPRSMVRDNFMRIQLQTVQTPHTRPTVPPHQPK